MNTFLQKVTLPSSFSQFLVKGIFSARKAALLLILSCLSFASQAGSGIFQTYVIFDRGSGNEYRAGGFNADNAATFNGMNLGTFVYGATLKLNGGEVKTFKNGGSDVFGANINYRIYPTSGSPGSFTAIALSFNADLGGGDQKWATTAHNVNMLAGLTTPGTYYLEVYWDSPSSDGTHFDTNFGANFKGTFTLACPTITINETHVDATCAGGAANGSIDITVSGTTLPTGTTQTYTQDFNTLLNTGTANTWTDNSTITNWYSNRTVYIGDNGSSTTGGLHSYGTTSASERALGSLGSTSANPVLYAVKITNTTGLTVNSVSVSFTGEQWRNGGTGSVPNTLDFAYQIDATSITAGSWTDVNALDFTSPITTGAAATLDGNNSLNRTALSSTFSVTLAAGSTIWLRWSDPDNTSSDHGLGIDDLTATLTASTSAYFWSNGATTEDLSGLTPGDYTVTITDVNNCTAQRTISIGISGETTWYQDADNDTYGNLAVNTLACTQPGGFVANSTDCNDNNNAIHPGATEIFNGLDDDCDGTADNLTPNGIYSYTSATSGVPNYVDGNATGSSLTRVNGATAPGSPCGTGFSSQGFSNTVTYISSLGAIEFTITPNSGFKVDAMSFSAALRRSSTGPANTRYAYSTNGGSSWIDEGADHSPNNSTCGTTTTASWDFADFASSQPVKFRIYGFNASSTGGVLQLLNVVLTGTVSPTVDNDGDGSDNTLDCNDNDNTIYPGATELCNGTDDDCDGVADDGLIFVTYYKDNDGDGYGNGAGGTTSSCAGSAPVDYSATNDDCDDGNPNVNPGETETCNGVDDDCTGGVDNGLTFVTYYKDNDGDGYGNGAGGTTATCDGSTPSGYAASNDDCDDGNMNVNPGETETCNGIDDDCVGGADDGLTFTTYYYDGDSDGYGNSDGGTTSTCDGLTPASYSATNDDCDDGDMNVNPGETETCNGIDDDCIGGADDGLTFTTYYYDGDGDGYGNDLGGTTSTCDGITPSGYSTTNDDCDDGDVDVNPGETETCNGIDDDCVGGADDGLTFTTYYYDGDSDGYGNSDGGTTSTCDGLTPASYSATNDDCDDGDMNVNPGETETCNGIDDDCIGGADDGLTFTTYYYDGDGDGYGNDLGGTTSTCDGITPSGYSTTNDDCDDGDVDVNPGETETCNGIDDDCIGGADDGLTFTTYYYDGDGDGYGNDLGGTTSTCDGITPSGYSATNDDCDDGDMNVNPGETETCNGIDDDCIGGADDGLTFTTYYYDGDGDGYGNDLGGTTSTCDGITPSGYSATNDDCDDGDMNVNPGETETCNGIDDDCVGGADDGLTFTTYYYDGDGDGYGNDLGGTTSTCDGITPSGYSATNDDCDDGDMNVNPGETETCNGIDDDCVGGADDGLTFTTYYYDGDGDGYGNDLGGTTSTCDGITPSGYSATNDDCDDGDMNVNPGETETCNGIDDNCDFQTDENGISATISASDPTTFCAEGSATLNASPSTADSYQWYDGNGAISGANSNSYEADATESYYVIVTSFSCSGTSNSISTTENPSPAATATPTGTITLCNDIPVTFNANSGGGLSYQWYRNGTPISLATNDNYTTPPSQAGKFKVKVTNSFNCSTMSNVDTIDRLHTPAAIVTIVNPAGNPDICINGKVKLRGNGSSTVPLAYEWYQNNILVGTSRDYTTTTVGNFKVKVTDLNTGCSRTSAEVAVINTCKNDPTLNVSQGVMNMYPNPSDGNFVIDLKLNEQVDGSAVVQVYNAIGQSVYNNVVPIDDGNLIKDIQLRENDPAGIYFVRVIVNEQVFSGQMVYQK